MSLDIQRVKQFAFLALTGFASGVTYFALTSGANMIAGGEAYAIACNMAEHGTFANPFAAGLTGPSAHQAPLFPLLFSYLLRVFGSSAPIAAILFEWIAQGVNVALMPLVSIELIGEEGPGVIAALASIVLPVYHPYPSWDAIYSADFIMIGIIVMAAFLRRAPAEAPTGCLAGLFLAIMLLLSSIGAVIMAAFFTMLVVTAKPRFEKMRSCAIAIVLTILVGISPWVIRNYRVFHSLVPLRDDLGIALYSSNNNCAQPTLAENLLTGCHAITHPDVSLTESRLIARVGEVEYNRRRLRDALKWIGTHRQRFVFLTANRALSFWFPPQRPSIWLISASAFGGLCLLVRRQRQLGWTLVCAFGFYPVIYYVVEAQERYLYPLLWCLCLAAGYLWSDVSARFRHSAGSARLA
jgi:hypothetical protein